MHVHLLAPHVPARLREHAPEPRQRLRVCDSARVGPLGGDVASHDRCLPVHGGLCADRDGLWRLHARRRQEPPRVQRDDLVEFGRAVREPQCRRELLRQQHGVRRLCRAGLCGDDTVPRRRVFCVRVHASVFVQHVGHVPERSRRRRPQCVLCRVSCTWYLYVCDVC